jgi:hypothetical protein
MLEFKIGEIVKIVGIVKEIKILSEKSIYYTILLEGSMPLLLGECMLNEKALRKLDDEDIKFFEDRSK